MQFAQDHQRFPLQRKRSPSVLKNSQTLDTVYGHGRYLAMFH